MFQRIYNNIRHDISGNYALIAKHAGRYKAMKYLSRVGAQLCMAVVLNKKTEVHNIKFYDVW
jgi:hypothetical protein